MNMGSHSQNDRGSDDGHGGMGGMWLMVLCCLPMVLIVVLIAAGLIGR